MAAVWYDSDDYEVYILNREHCYGQWEITKEASAAAEGTEQQTCAGCGDEKTRKVIPVQLTAAVDPETVTAGADPADISIRLSASNAADGTNLADWEMEYVITDEAGNEVTLAQALENPGKYTITPKSKTP